MGDPFLCQVCGVWFMDLEDLDKHQRTCLSRQKTPVRQQVGRSKTTFVSPNPWGYNKKTAIVVIALAQKLAKTDPRIGVSEDIDDAVKAAYEYEQMVPPFETLMRTPEDDRRELLALIKEYEEEHGEITQNEIAAIEAEFDDAGWPRPS